MCVTRRGITPSVAAAALRLPCMLPRKSDIRRNGDKPQSTAGLLVLTRRAGSLCFARKILSQGFPYNETDCSEKKEKHTHSTLFS